MKEILLVAALATASPAPAVVTTVALSYVMPTHGYRSQSDVTAAGAHATFTVLADSYGNKDVDATLEANGKTTRQEYLFMDGLAYVKAGDNWALARNLTPAFTVLLMTAGTYPQAANYSAIGRVVQRQGEGPCGAVTCLQYVSTRVTKSNEKPTVNVTHLAVDKSTNQLTSLESTTYDATNKVLNQMHAAYDVVPQHLAVPTIVDPVTPTCYLSNGSIGAINLCLYKGDYSFDLYTISVNGQLALRATDASAANGVSSPVIDGLTLQCATKKQPAAINPDLAATLKQSGMTDDQIAQQLGEKPVASDCTVSSNGTPVMTQHYDFK